MATNPKPSSSSLPHNCGSSDAKEGYLDILKKDHLTWKKRWCILKHGNIYIFKCKTTVMEDYIAKEVSGKGCIPLSTIGKLRTDEPHGPTSFKAVTSSRTYIFKAETVDERNDWFFAFYKELAQVITQITSQVEVGGSSRVDSIDELDDGNEFRKRTRSLSQSPKSRRITVDNSEIPGVRLPAKSELSSSKTDPPVHAAAIGGHGIPTPFAFKYIKRQTSNEILLSKSYDADSRSVETAKGAIAAIESSSIIGEGYDYETPLVEGPRLSTILVNKGVSGTGHAAKVPSLPSAVPTFTPGSLKSALDGTHPAKGKSKILEAAKEAALLADSPTTLSDSEEGVSTLHKSSNRWVPPHKKKKAPSPLMEPVCDESFEETQFELSLDDNEAGPTRHTKQRGDSVGDDAGKGDVEKGDEGNIGVTSMQGKRDYMEDRYVIVPDITKGDGDYASTAPSSLYAIFDGHCGSRAADYCAVNLHEEIMLNVSTREDPSSAIVEAFHCIDRKFLEIATSKNMYDGSAAIVALVLNGKLIVANLGDCCALLCRKGEFVLMNEIHSPFKEKARIESVGGWVTVEKELYVAKIHQMDLTDSFVVNHVNRSVRWVTTSRVNGELAVSRAIGDSDYKGKGMEEYCWAFPADKAPGFKFSGDLVLSTPTIQETVLTDDDSFFLIACDGLWDVLNCAEVVEFVKSMLTQREPAQEITDALVSLAIRLGSTDNVTCVLVVKPSEGWDSRSSGP